MILLSKIVKNKKGACKFSSPFYVKVFRSSVANMNGEFIVTAGPLAYLQKKSAFHCCFFIVNQTDMKRDSKIEKVNIRLYGYT